MATILYPLLFPLPLAAGILRARFAFALGFRPRFALRFRSVLRLGVGLGSLFVRVAAVVGLVEARASEDDPGAGPDSAPGLGLAAFRTLFRRFGHDRLEFVPGVAAAVADVIVGGHE